MLIQYIAHQCFIISNAIPMNCKTMLIINFNSIALYNYAYHTHCNPYMHCPINNISNAIRMMFITKFIMRNLIPKNTQLVLYMQCNPRMQRTIYLSYAMQIQCIADHTQFNSNKLHNYAYRSNSIPMQCTTMLIISKLCGNMLANIQLSFCSTILIIRICALMCIVSNVVQNVDLSVQCTEHYVAA